MSAFAQLEYESVLIDPWGASREAMPLQNFIIRTRYYAAPDDAEDIVSVLNRADTLMAIERLPAEAPENWNGRGAKAVTAEAVKQAKGFLGTLSYKVPVPSVSATSNGSICFAWDGPDGSVLQATVSPGGRLVYGMDAGSNRTQRGGVDFDGSAIPDIEKNLLTFIYPSLR